MKFLTSLKDQFLYIVLLILAIVYFMGLSPFLQGGDTAELVSAAKNLTVAHPPGYPLWIWIEWGWMHLFPFTTVFFQASFLSALFALGALFFTLLPLKKHPPLLILVAMSLGLSISFFESAILPDVFSLHALLVASLSWFYLFAKNQKARFFFIPFHFFLGLAHHLTIIFLFPLILFTFYEAIKKKEAAFFIGAGLGFLLFILLYSSLLFMHPGSYFSWGNLLSIKDVLTHFLRSDYGTLTFAPSKTAAPFDALVYFSQTTLFELGSLILVSVVLGFSELKNHFNLKLIIWITSLMAVLAFFFMVNFEMKGMGIEIITRFHVMPAVVITFTCVYLLKMVDPKWGTMTLLSVFSILAIAPQCLQNIQTITTLKHDSVIEDYSFNMLSIAEKTGAKLILVNNDTAYFGLKYTQAIHKLAPHTAIISPSLFFHPWFYEKIKVRVPELELQNTQAIWDNRSLNLEKDLIIPNSAKFPILSAVKLKSQAEFKSTQLELGELYTSGTGSDISNDPVITKSPESPYPVEDSPQEFSKKILKSEYSHIYLSRGMIAYKKKENDQAVKEFEHALKIVPYCGPALQNLCTLRPSSPQCSKENTEWVKEQSELIY